MCHRTHQLIDGITVQAAHGVRVVLRVAPKDPYGSARVPAAFASLGAAGHSRVFGEQFLLGILEPANGLEPSTC